MLQKLPARSDEAEITVEDLEGVLKEIPPLFVRYWREVINDEALPPDPDWHSLLRQSAMGQVLFVAVRHEGVLVGFALNLFSFHVTHRNVPHATVLWIYLDPAYRLGSFGLKFIKRNFELIEQKFEAMKITGAKRIVLATPDERAAAIYERLGFKFIEAGYAKVI